MAIDTFIAFVGVYDNVSDADADYALVKDLHTKEHLIDSYDAAVIQRRADGKVKITKKHETPTRVGGVLGGGVGLATGLVVVLFPFAAIGGNRSSLCRASYCACAISGAYWKLLPTKSWAPPSNRSPWPSVTEPSTLTLNEIPASSRRT